MRPAVALVLILLGIFLAVYLPMLLKRKKQPPKMPHKLPHKRPQGTTSSGPMRAPARPHIAPITRHLVTVKAKMDGTANLHREAITEADLPLIEKLAFTDWSGTPFNTPLMLMHRKWVVNPDRSVILLALGGGSFEIPEMYDFVYQGHKVRIHCGGGGMQGKTFTRKPDQSISLTICVTELQMPPALIQDQNAVFALMAEAFAVEVYGADIDPALHVEVAF